MVAKARILHDALSALSDWVLLWTGIGIAISAYALHVEFAVDADHEYAALCDLSSWISCTKVLETPSATGFGLIGPLLGHDHPLNQKNALYGLVVYFFIALLSRSRSTAAITFNYYLSWGIIIGSIYLVVVMVQIGALCLVCLGIYGVNGALLSNGYRRKRVAEQLERERRREGGGKKKL